MPTIYTKNKCVQCVMTKRAFAREGIEYIERNVDDEPELKAELVAEGWLAMPVVKTNSTSWSGFQPDKIKTI